MVNVIIFTTILNYNERFINTNPVNRRAASIETVASSAYNQIQAFCLANLWDTDKILFYLILNTSGIGYFHTLMWYFHVIHDTNMDSGSLEAVEKQPVDIIIKIKQIVNV